jgi:flagellar basal body-associated protein FliL
MHVLTSHGYGAPGGVIWILLIVLLVVVILAVAGRGRW